MSIRYLGARNVGALNLGLSLALPSLANALTALTSQAAELSARAKATADLVATPPSPASLLAALSSVWAAFLSSLPATVASLPATLGSVSLELAADAGATLGRAQALGALVGQLQAAASAGGVHAYATDGPVGTLGPELARELLLGLPGGQGPAERVRGVLFLTSDAATFQALSTVLVTG